ncbi:hypothetical protein POTOM_003100 [Populus tomentosa]|uniref:Uncharacterized protein n=1 Tax=Populus tomentosa TaxID=118781 RepID=A0A8X8IXY5_POPTO|nr:hypothetical protein POTOM_003100 [Populus tomentosa]
MSPCQAEGKGQLESQLSPYSCLKCGLLLVQFYIRATRKDSYKQKQEYHYSTVAITGIYFAPLNAQAITHITPRKKFAMLTATLHIARPSASDLVIPEGSFSTWYSSEKDLKVGRESSKNSAIITLEDGANILVLVVPVTVWHSRLHKGHFCRIWHCLQEVKCCNDF